MINGDTLRILRNRKGLVQKQAADLLRISQPAYCKLEKKKEIQGRTLEKIKKAFGLTDNHIEYIKNYPPPHAK